LKLLKVHFPRENFFSIYKILLTSLAGAVGTAQSPVSYFRGYHGTHYGSMSLMTENKLKNSKAQALLMTTFHA
jgi:adenosylmethionine-8-amino-7-oxononanoate aminotransferase